MQSLPDDRLADSSPCLTGVARPRPRPSFTQQDATLTGAQVEADEVEHGLRVARRSKLSCTRTAATCGWSDPAARQHLRRIGIARLVLRPPVARRYRALLAKCPLVLAEGRVQRAHGVTNLQVTALKPLGMQAGTVVPTPATARRLYH